MARKGQVAIQESIETNEEFVAFLEVHYEQLICMEVYCEFCGYCLATGNAVRRGKLEIGQDDIAMAKALCDKIDALVRFRNKSEPVFLFISKGKLMRAMFGANGIELCRIIEEELASLNVERETGEPVNRFEIEHMLPEEAEKIEEDLRFEEQQREAIERIRTVTQAARKRRVCDRLSRHVKRLNFILFWPHCHKAHYDLYEKWDMINISVGAKETFFMTPEMAKEALYMSDVDMNEACIHSLCNGEALCVLFKMLETDTRDFVKILRYALYEDIPVPKPDTPPEKQLPPIPAFERYASISKTTREVRRERYNARMAKLQEEKEEKERLEREQARLIREAEEDRIMEKKKRQEEERIARLQAGLPADPEPEPKGEEVQEEEVVKEEIEELKEEIEPEEEAVPEEFHSDISVEDEEYIPPGGLFVPGLYTPPNELAKANGLAFFFEKAVRECGPIESEFMPPHVLVMFAIEKRHDVKEIINLYADEILNVGVFAGDELATLEHVAFSIKQYDKMSRIRRHKDRLALMVSRKRSLPLLQLAGLNPYFISSDVDAGEKDCLALFPVGYGDNFIEEESLHDEEIPEVLEVPVEAPAPPPPPEEEAPAPEKVEEEEEKDE